MYMLYLISLLLKKGQENLHIKNYKNYLHKWLNLIKCLWANYICKKMKFQHMIMFYIQLMQINQTFIASENFKTEPSIKLMLIKEHIIYYNSLLVMTEYISKEKSTHS